MDHESTMENEELEKEKTPYVPRPKWQIVCAWIALVLMVAGVGLYYWHIASGGMMR